MPKFAIRPCQNGVGRVGLARLAAVVVTGLSLAACGGASFQNLPKEMGGLPTDTPARPATPLAYPAVHDMPPPRVSTVLTPEQLKEAEAELTAVRDKQPKPPENKTRAGNKQDTKKQEN